MMKWRKNFFSCCHKRRTKKLFCIALPIRGQILDLQIQSALRCSTSELQKFYGERGRFWVNMLLLGSIMSFSKHQHLSLKKILFLITTDVQFSERSSFEYQLRKATKSAGNNGLEIHRRHRLIFRLLVRRS